MAEEPFRDPEVLDECLARLSTTSDPRTELGARANPKRRVSAVENFMVRLVFVCVDSLDCELICGVFLVKCSEAVNDQKEETDFFSLKSQRLKMCGQRLVRSL